MARTSYQDQFLKKLTELSKNGSELVSHIALRNGLGWTDSEGIKLYWEKEEELERLGQVISQRGGKGGLIGLATEPGTKALSIFVSYSHHDQNLKDALVKHLKPLETRLRIISSWHDEMIKAGDNWDKEIMSKLNDADIALMLISIDFINSKFCYDEEMEHAIELHKQNKIRLIPIIVRACVWDFTPFAIAKIQALLVDKPLAMWPNLDEGCSYVAGEVRKIAGEMRSQL